MKLLETKNICKVYGKNDTRVDALKDVNISINQGEFVAVTGDSGSGKSTLLHILGTVDYPTSGSLLFEDKDVFKQNEDELSKFRLNNIGFVFQFFNLVPVLTVEENISMPFILKNESPDKERVNEVLEFLGLSEKRKSLPNQLSGGQQQRVAIGRAIIHKPKVILADEPTGNLDSKNESEIMNLLSKSVKENNQTLIVITHNPKIASYADRNIVIKDGQVTQKGSDV